MDNHKKSILKSVTWRIIAVVITTAVAFMFTGKAALSVGIGSADSLVKLFGYYLHERAWNRIKI